jgi:hypothetical protein
MPSRAVAVPRRAVPRCPRAELSPPCPAPCRPALFLRRVVPPPCRDAPCRSALGRSAPGRSAQRGPAPCRPTLFLRQVVPPRAVTPLAVPPPGRSAPWPFRPLAVPPPGRSAQRHPAQRVPSRGVPAPRCCPAPPPYRPNAAPCLSCGLPSRAVRSGPSCAAPPRLGRCFAAGRWLSSGPRLGDDRGAGPTRPGGIGAVGCGDLPPWADAEPIDVD